VLVNVISNAAKYTEPRGRVRIGALADSGQVVLRVKDSGIGISADMLPRVFDMFAQERQALDRSEGGLGLGLSIVKSLVELHGGTVEALSAGAGTGSEFVIRLPVASSTSDALRLNSSNTAAVRATGPRRRILVVDDNVDAARMMAAALELAGHDAQVAFDGPSALDAAAAAPPDAALLDLGLPVMDGYELAERLAAAHSDDPPILIAVTGYGQVSDRERTAAAGFDAHIVKPVDVPHLLELIDSLCRAIR
jgi:CheY-like chemotaxis protein